MTTECYALFGGKLPLCPSEQGLKIIGYEHEEAYDPVFSPEYENWISVGDGDILQNHLESDGVRQEEK